MYPVRRVILCCFFFSFHGRNTFAFLLVFSVFCFCSVGPQKVRDIAGPVLEDETRATPEDGSMML